MHIELVSYHNLLFIRIGYLSIHGSQVTANIGCLSIYGFHVTDNNFAYNNIVFFFVSDLKKVYYNKN